MTAVKEIAKRIFLESLRRIDLGHLIRNQVSSAADALSIAGERVSLSAGSRIFVVGIGKACPSACLALEEIIGGRLSGGVVVTNVDPPADCRTKLRWLLSAHPIPDQRSILAANEILNLLRGLTANDLVIFVITGGGSAMVEKPVSHEITLADLAALNRALILSSAPIHEINIVRKHFSAVKGGRLAQAAAPARQFSFYVSDVNDDDLSSVASGPTSPDSSSLSDAGEVLEKFRLRGDLPPTISELLRQKQIPETAKAGDPAFARARHVLLASNRLAVSIAEEVAAQYDAIVRVDSTVAEGPYREIANRLMLTLSGLKGVFHDRMVILISGGEAICPVTGKGIGGRNQEMALYAATRLETEFPACEAAFLAAGTDGIDGNSDAAGAVADTSTMARARSLGLAAADALADNDSYRFFKPLGDLVCTGPTGNNVRDLRVLIAR